MGVPMLVWRGRLRPRLLVTRTLVMMRMLVMVVVAVRMFVIVVSFGGPRHHILLRPVLLPRHILFAIDPHVNLGRRDPAPHHLGYFELRADSERRDGFFQQSGRYPGIHQGAKEHIAADAGKAFKVGNAHKSSLTTEFSS